MLNPVQLEETFKKYTEDLTKWAPDGIIELDIELLKSLNLLNIKELDLDDAEQELTQQFNIIESPEKITLYNPSFIIWIVPDLVDNAPTTFALLAQQHDENPQLELVLSISGPYNTPRLVLKVIQKMLKEIQDNEKALDHLN